MMQDISNLLPADIQWFVELEHGRVDPTLVLSNGDLNVRTSMAFDDYPLEDSILKARILDPMILALSKRRAGA
jgi:hypothetical protein